MKKILVYVSITTFHKDDVREYCDASFEPITRNIGNFSDIRGHTPSELAAKLKRVIEAESQKAKNERKRFEVEGIFVIFRQPCDASIATSENMRFERYRTLTKKEKIEFFKVFE